MQAHVHVRASLLTFFSQILICCEAETSGGSGGRCGATDCLLFVYTGWLSVLMKPRLLLKTLRWF